MNFMLILCGRQNISMVKGSQLGACGPADQCWIHKQKVVGSSPVTVNVLGP